MPKKTGRAELLTDGQTTVGKNLRREKEKESVVEKEDDGAYANISVIWCFFSFFFLLLPASSSVPFPDKRMHP